MSTACDIKSAYLLFSRSVFERRAPRSVAAVEASLGARLTQGNSARSLPEELLSALTAAYREGASPHGGMLPIPG